ncbi:HPr kinase/phosphorylase [Sphingomonas abietis]|uniref:HPr kinase/phosphatase C-terminal domain-containing protein n=1 Tax=Sphingomonas abietis TaxID=3012344 RepID=A0ABY7NRV7_9SPHN|nr:HPr kinase/phosphatase C-terminal domain-containing protein [Sphingomonas abietis]WBO24138.1 HPr kinase/phosphatase C-terminal domain-containing protein [Sphingomonas abietis]
MSELSSDLVHASCVAIGGRAVLLSGRSGSGKSDLALRLIDRGAALVSDDYTEIRRRDGRLFATPPARLAGKIEVRGIGIVEMPHLAEAEVALMIDLESMVARMPDAATRRLAGRDVPVASLAALEPSAPIKVELLLKAQTQIQMPPPPPLQQPLPAQTLTQMVLPR